MTERSHGMVDAIGLLHEPVRRAVYEYVAAQPGPVGRDSVAEAVGVGRTLAAFHLDKLAAGGLLTVSFARRPGRTGPRAGRPAKLYRRTPDELSISVPPREYRTLAGILAEALEDAGADAEARAAAHRRGVARAPAPDGDLLDHLATLGYEPVPDGADIRLRNCPFGAVAHEFPPLVCGLNLAYIRGMLAGAGCAEDAARLDARPDGCCVAIRRT
jgi:predicted ArsR family transcriptional regulator